jgi:hypothetical protein
MLERGTATTPAATPRPTATSGGRFARDPGEYAATGRARLRLIHPTTSTTDTGQEVR